MVKKAWNKITLAQIGTFKKGSGISRAESNSGNLPAVRYGEIYTIHNNYVRKYNSRISREVADKALRVHCGDILFACSGETKKDIAKCVAIIDDMEVFAGGDIIVLSPTMEVDPVFLGFILNTPEVARQRAQKAQGDAIVHISTESLKTIEFLLPEYSEQCKIAIVLSDIDSLIENLEKLIFKKKVIKQSVIQRTLTQNNSSTKTLFLKDLCTITTGKMDANAASRSGKYKFFTCGREDLRIDTYAFDGDAILIAGNGDVGHTKIYSGKFNAYQRTYVLMNFTINPYLLKQYIDLELSKAILTDLQGGAMPYIKISTLENLTFKIPKSTEIQLQIVSLLIDLDSEINQLEKTLSKYKNIKLGMMSELLTGRIRLIDKEEK